MLKKLKIAKLWEINLYILNHGFLNGILFVLTLYTTE